MEACRRKVTFRENTVIMKIILLTIIELLYYSGRTIVLNRRIFVIVCTSLDFHAIFAKVRQGKSEPV